MHPVTAIGAPGAVQTPSVITGPGTAGSGGSSFAQTISDLLQDASAQHVQADSALQQLATGQSDSIHNVVLSMAKADLSFRLVLEIRNRLIESYQEIMRMQV